MKSSQKLLVGVFLIGGILLFAVGLFWIGDRRQLFTRSTELHTEFRNLSGLKNGSKVRVAGVDAGEILAIEVPPGPEAKFRLRFRVADRLLPLLRSDSVTTIQNEGLVGSRFLQVDAGSEAGREIAPGDTIPSREPVEVADLLQQASGTVQKVSLIVEEVREGVDMATEGVMDVTQKTGNLVEGIGSQVERITTATNRIVDRVDRIVDGVQQGEGTIGKLLHDDALYERIRDSADQAQQTAKNIRQTSEDLSSIAADVKTSDLVGDLEAVVDNTREITGRAKELVTRLQPEGSDGEGLTANLRQTIENANEAMANFAENTEALKRNWFFRGFFQDRGFYDLNAISMEDYRQGRFAPEHPSLREWLYEAELFATRPDGTEQLSEPGKKRLDQAMAGLIAYTANNPLIVEGYTAKGDEGEIFLRSRDRAQMVRAYLIRRFQLQPNYVGMMPMESVKSSAPGGEPWEGVALVLYLPKGTVVSTK
ncbi:MAG: MCE family protein [Acidobacteria bacterium]|nr:MCE family protein [Acidobacteriota bacterium]